METKTTLLQDSFQRTTYRLSGHGDRNIQVLQDALEAIAGETPSDIYGKGEIIERFEVKMAQYLGKSHAVFFPSGTMAQQIALRIWCDRIGVPKVAYHPLCHLEIHEQNGLQKLHHIESVLLADQHRLITLDDVRALETEISCLLLELPQREIGGQLPAFEEVEAITNHCKEQGIKTHLDGARLFEILPHYGKTAADISQLFDSVYVSFYKGIGGIAGAVLASDDEAFIQEAIVWKRRHGGDLISLYPYILSSDHYFTKRIGRMETYYSQAIKLAEKFNACHGVTTRPIIPVSNMFHVHFKAPLESVTRILANVQALYGIGFTSWLRTSDDKTCLFELSIGDAFQHVPEEQLEAAFSALDAELRATSVGR